MLINISRQASMMYLAWQPDLEQIKLEMEVRIEAPNRIYHKAWPLSRRWTRDPLSLPLDNGH